MNVLPVLIDLSPSIKSDLPISGTGSSVGEFERILDRTLSGTTLAGGMSTAPQRPDIAPYASPLREQSPTPEKQPDPSRNPVAAKPADSSAGATTLKPQGTEQASGEAHAKDRSKVASGSQSSGKSKGDPASHVAVTEKAKGNQKKGQTAEKSAKQSDGNVTKGPQFPGAIVIAGSKRNLVSAT
ncbi:MAG TPA: hypothetical protein VMW69_11535, partial [Spirochaetia bacterium]|nr:hypothetical protein [Spirochaetia bacterium]